MNIQKKAVDLTDLAIGIIMLGVVVSIGGTILLKMRDTRLTELTTVETTETVSPSTTGTALTDTWVKSIDAVVNFSGTADIGAVNYTTAIDDYGTGTISNVTTWNEDQNEGWNVTYTWYNTTSRQDYTVTQDASIGLGEYGNWFKIIVIVGVAAVVLSLIFMAFGKGSPNVAGESGGIGGSY